MKIIPLCRSCFFLFLFVISSNALPMMGRSNNLDNNELNINEGSAFKKTTERGRECTTPLNNTLANEQGTPTTSSLEDEAGMFRDESSISSNENEFIGVPYYHHDINLSNIALKIRSESNLCLRPPSEEEVNEDEVKVGKRFPGSQLLRAVSFPITRRSSSIVVPTTPLVTPPRNKAAATMSWKEGPIPKLDLNEPLSHIEQIITTAVEKNAAALVAANANHETLTEAALSVKQEEFNRLANLWIKVIEVSSLLQDEKNQLRGLTRQMELPESLLQPQSEMGDEMPFSQHQKLAQDAIDSLRSTIAPHEKTVDFLFRGTVIIDDWIHDLWTNHLIFAASSSSVADVDLRGIQEFEKENSYKNGVSILQIFAANHGEDQDQEIASFFATVAESEYKNMQNIALENQVKRDEIIERNKNILAFCSTVDSLQEKIKKNVDLAQKADQERVAVLYEEAAQWHEENCRLIIRIVQQLILGHEVDPSLENTSQELSNLASGAELQAQRIKALRAGSRPLGFVSKISEVK